jgi:hypothetical protein
MACIPFVARPSTLADVLESKGYILTPEERVTRQQIVTPGFHGIICGSPGIETCRCGNVADRYCDYPMGSNRTCDVAVCANCGTSVAPEFDLCPIHAAEHGSRVLAVTAPRHTG